MKVNGKKIKLTASERFFIKMVQNIKDNGSKTINMVGEKKLRQMAHITMEYLKRAINKDKVTLNGSMDLVIKENLTIMNFMVLESISGQTKEATRVFGTKIKCMVMEFSFGLINENTKVKIHTIKNVD